MRYQKVSSMVDTDINTCACTKLYTNVFFPYSCKSYNRDNLLFKLSKYIIKSINYFLYMYYSDMLNYVPLHYQFDIFYTNVCLRSSGYYLLYKWTTDWSNFTLKLISSSLLNPSLCIIFICFTRVLLPLSPAPIELKQYTSFIHLEHWCNTGNFTAVLHMLKLQL